MNRISDTLIVIPVHKISAVIARFCERSINSAIKQSKNADVIILCNNSIKDRISKIKVFEEIKDKYEKEINPKFYYGFKFVDDINSFQEVFNYSFNLANEMDYKYFSLLEFDDIIADKYVEQSVDYIEQKNIDITNPITLCFVGGDTGFDDPKKRVIAQANDIAWAPQLFHEEGIFDLDGLLKYNNATIIMSNAMYKTSLWNNQAKPGMKINIKWKFDREFMLRLVYQGAKIYVIPKLLALHMIKRPDSLIENIVKELNQEKAEKWDKLVNREFFFNNDRNIEI